jgi:hypothetical protein
MCLSVYIASECSLPLVAEGEAGAGFRIEPAVVYPDESFGRQFSKPFVYSASLHDGCGCGFQFDGFYDDQGDYIADDRPDQVAARRALAALLSAALQCQATVEVLTCCSGDELYPPKHRRRARPEDFIRDRTLFRFGELVIVSDQDNEPVVAPAPAP